VSDDATGEGRKVGPDSIDSTDADATGVDGGAADEVAADGTAVESERDIADDVTPGGDTGVTADMVEAAETDALVEAGETVDGDGSAGAQPNRRDGELVGATAGSARAAARRQAVRSGKTERKGTATVARDGRQEKGNIFSRLSRFLREVVAELRKVIWPTRKEMITYTVVVIVFVVFMVALVAGLDVLFAKGVLTVFG